MKEIISCSRRTDIPAFFYKWMQEALQKGMVEVPNPMFSNRTYIVDLQPSNVHTIVLWSKNFNNVLKNPMYLDNYNLYFQYTINNYSKIIEPNVPTYRETISTIEGMLKKYIPEQFNIRFDPIIISLEGEINPTSDIPDKARLMAFEQLCRDIKALGMENCRMTTSYLQMYSHIRTRIKNSGLDIIDLDEDAQLKFFSQMSEIAYKYNVSLYSCASPILENVNGIKRGCCIDGRLLEELFGDKARKARDNSQRKFCGCTYSRDIGIYSKSINGMKCLHGCLYCYA